MMMKSDFLSDLFLNSHLLKGMFTSTFVNCYSISMLGLGVYSFFGHYVGNTITMVNSKFPLPSLNIEHYCVP